jgi:hypothetical protein
MLSNDCLLFNLPRPALVAVTSQAGVLDKCRAGAPHVELAAPGGQSLLWLRLVQSKAAISEVH